VARTGSISGASKELRLASPTISSQIRKLEDSLGEKLFHRSGRRLALTDVGQVAMRYGEEIFSLGQEFTSRMEERPTGRPLRFCVGIADVLPKATAFQLIKPALSLSAPVHLVCRQDRPDHLLADLAVHDVDVVLSDAPASAAANIRAFSHLLGECSVTFFAPKQLAFLKKGFPRSLDGSPLLPLEDTTLRRDFGRMVLHQEPAAECRGRVCRPGLGSSLRRIGAWGVCGAHRNGRADASAWVL